MVRIGYCSLIDVTYTPIICVRSEDVSLSEKDQLPSVSFVLNEIKSILGAKIRKKN